ncbi:uracil permease [Oxobacter pfennigii]|uniref:Uracil permease n=1 Tax=Oxobacter pfennigii TaxID=36849 RepID=A0A0N8NTK8_9CLOT|nr:solute carrier family 23 protein [Oxobacter pfennigii]KPU45112.1 uracil permease [Oxobacter pfennigii]
MNEEKLTGYLPDENPPIWKLILFALQQILIMFPATVLVALLTGFHVSTTLFASGFATLCFMVVTKRQIPLFYGSSFSYISAIVAITGVKEFGQVASDSLIAEAQFGIMASGLVSIAAGFMVNKFGKERIDKILPPTITGSIAIVIGLSLAGTAMSGAAAHWPVALITLLATMFFSVFLKGTYGQLSILLGIILGYIVSIPFGLVDFGSIAAAAPITVPHFTLPKMSLASALAVMPIAIATIPESSAHLFQLDLYVNDLAVKTGSKKKYKIADKLGLNLIGDGIGDIVSALIGGPAGTNYGENLSTMAITRNFSSLVLIVAAVITMVISFSGTLSAVVNSIPGAVIGGITIYLFGVIGVQGLAIMISQQVDMFDTRNLAIISTILTIGLGGTFAFEGGLIPMFGLKLPAIATAAVFGIIINALLGINRNN